MITLNVMSRDDRDLVREFFQEVTPCAELIKNFSFNTGVPCIGFQTDDMIRFLMTFSFWLGENAETEVMLQFREHGLITEVPGREKTLVFYLPGMVWGQEEVDEKLYQSPTHQPALPQQPEQDVVEREYEW